MMPPPDSATLRALPSLHSGHITADKRLRRYAPSPKLPYGNFFYPQSVMWNILLKRK